MISLNNKRLDTFAQEHYQAIKNYFDQKKGGYSLKTLDHWIHNTLGSNYNLEKVVTSRPEELFKVKAIWKGLGLTDNQLKDYNYFITLYSYLSKNKYKKADSSPYNAYTIGENLKIRVCPYCNENLAYNITKTFRRTYDLDHFYSKDLYPILAISFFNLIPSCKVCNHNKSNIDNEYIHPYDDAVDFTRLFHFSLDVNGYDFIRDVNEYAIKLTCHNLCAAEHKGAIENLIEDLHLDKRYQQHKDIILELLYKNQIYNSDYIDDLFQSYQGNLFKNREDVLRLLIGNYVNEEDLGKRPLAKLMKDISEALGLI